MKTVCYRRGKTRTARSEAGGDNESGSRVADQTRKEEAMKKLPEGRGGAREETDGLCPYSPNR